MKKFKKAIVLLMAMVMVFAMSATAFADTAGSAQVNIYLVDETGVSMMVDSQTVDAGQNIYQVVEGNFKYYEPDWTEGTDVYDGSTVFYLNDFVGYGPVNLDHQYNADGSGWSKDWGWQFTVNDEMPAFADNPEHGMAMNQYIIQDGDSIDIAYTLTNTSWDASFNTDFEIVYPWK